MDTETVTVHKKGEDFEIAVQHDQSGSSYGMPLSKNAYEQLRQHFVSGSCFLNQSKMSKETEQLKQALELAKSNPIFPNPCYMQCGLITKNMERKRILSQVNINTDMFMTSFEKAAKLILEQKDKLEKEGWTSVHFKMDYYHDGAELIVMGMRLENDAEYNIRVADEQKKLVAAQKKAERELKKYEELKLKYES